MTMPILAPIEYQTNPMSPMDRNIMVTSGEGGVKTWLNCGESISLAAGRDYLGMPVEQCPVLMIDEETPTADLEDRLNRLAIGLGFPDYKVLPITIASKQGFHFSQRNLTAIKDVEAQIKQTVSKLPNTRSIAIRIDSVIACLGAGLQRMDENNSMLGRVIHHTCDHLRKFCANELGIKATITILAHGKKNYPLYDLDDLRKSDMQLLVRGHGSIVGEGCDIGYAIKKITEKPLRGLIIPRVRRTRSPIEEIYFELEEEQYMSGWAKFQKIAPVPIPPSPLEVDYFSMFYPSGNEYSEPKLSQMASLHAPEERRIALDHLKKHRIIISESGEPFTYRLNPDFYDASKQKQDDRDYALQLSATYFAGGGQIKSK